MPMTVNAAYLLSDPYPAATNPKPTHCNFYIDAAAPVKLPVVNDGQGVYCKMDLGTVALTDGNHSATATHVIVTPGAADQESVKSNVATFTWPIVTAPPPPSAPQHHRMEHGRGRH